MQLLHCPWEAASFVFISSNVPLLINYSHFIAIFSALAVGLLIFFNNPKLIISRLLLIFVILFSLWALLDVSLWATNDPALVMFAWSMQVLIEPLTYAIAFYIFYIFAFKSIPNFKLNLAISFLLLPLIILLPTTYNLESIALSSCESIEGPIAKYYTYILNLIFIMLIFVTAVKALRITEKHRRRVLLLFVTGLLTFLLSFTSGNIISSFTDNWTISQYGLFGMPVFAFLIAYCIVQFEAFKIQIAGAQVLVVVLWALVCSLIFVESELLKIIAGLTLVFTTVAGYLLIQSVHKEFEQRKEIEDLALKLQKANDRLKVLDKMKSEFVSIASHQLRSPLTSIRGYASMLLEGSFGKLPKKAEEAVEHIEKSSSYMASSVEDYLNVSRIQAGNMKYDYTDVNLSQLTKNIVDDLRQQAVKQGLLLTFKSNLKSQGIINADIGKTRQIIHNLINNAIKYTPHGSIKVTVYEKVHPKRILVDIIDTGVGMSTETIEEMFNKFERADNAHNINTAGTGLGLYIAKKMANDMGGDISAASAGEGEGSTFSLEFPLKK